MLLTRYKLTLDQGDWAEAHFELRIDDQNRPFHIVFRPGDNTFGMNTLIDDIWQEEISIPLPSPMAEISTVLVDVQGRAIVVLIGENVYQYEMNVLQQDHHLIGASKNLVADFVVRQASEATPLVQSAASDNGKEAAGITTIDILGQTLTIPETVNAAVANRLVYDAAVDPSVYLNFMTSRPITQNGGLPTLIDIEGNTVLLALTGALLLPQATVLKLVSDDIQGEALMSIAAANDLTGIRIASHADVVDTLNTGTTPVVIQGGLVFDLLGDTLDALDTTRREQISIWSVALEIVPGNRIFPCANMQLWTPPHWTMNHNASISLSGRRPGVDVTVAAYNAKDYLIECAESLLCKDRDDVRVIIVDDGSSDGSGEEAAKYFKDEPRVRVEHKPNGGCASARNYGRLVSDATHIAFVDADDFVTDGFFGDLYDLALYTGCEVTQAGFDFYDDSLKEPYYPSYEEEVFKDRPRDSFKGQPLIWLPSADIIKGQPTIWRRVYRRDFLDAKNIYFPENVRAYDDYIFQMFTLTAARNIPMLPEHKYHYRQHPAQDIKQGDERHFYMLFMFQMLIKRSIAEGWPNFRPYAESIIDCIGWSSSILRDDLVDSFLLSGARFCVGMAKCYQPAIVEDILDRVEHPDFRYHYEREKQKYADIAPGAFWAFFNGTLYHPDIIRMRQSMQKAS